MFVGGPTAVPSPQIPYLQNLLNPKPEDPKNDQWNDWDWSGSDSEPQSPRETK